MLALPRVLTQLDALIWHVNDAKDGTTAALLLSNVGVAHFVGLVFGGVGSLKLRG